MTEQLQLRVTGMTCGGCENAVRRVVGRLDGVQEVTASHRDEVVSVTYDSDKVSADEIRERITAIGYQVAFSKD